MREAEMSMETMVETVTQGWTKGREGCFGVHLRRLGGSREVVYLDRLRVSFDHRGVAMAAESGRGSMKA